MTEAVANITLAAARPEVSAAAEAGTKASASGSAAPPRGNVLPAPERRPVDDGNRAELVQNFLRDTQRALKFSTDAATGRTIITVVNPETGDVIRQVPPEVMLAIARAIGRTASVLVDTRI
jgi:flagellar protein FlaG